ncbi:MAG TPA: tetratricopeptide repeat protein [Anaeromyxobacter sp.]
MDTEARPTPTAAGTSGAGRVPVHLGAAVAIGVLATAAYANALAAPFTFDDVVNFVEVPGLHMVALDPASIARAASGFPTGRWLARLSFALNHLAGGRDPRGYHVVNLAFHLGAALLAYALALEVLSRMRGATRERVWRPALLAALLFALHPVQTQAVTYVVQRMTSMGAFFGLGALLLYLRSRDAAGRARIAWGGAALVAAYLAFACKETYVVLPLLALVLEAFLVPGLGERLRRNAGRVSAAAAGAAAGGAALLWAYRGALASEYTRYGMPIADRLLSQPRVLVHYVSLLVLPLPSRLQIDYDWPPSHGLLDPPGTLPALAALVAVAAAAVLARRRAPLFAFAVAWFLGALAVEQTVLPIDLVFEHRLYVASFGLFLLAAAAVERLAGARVARWAAAAPVVAALAWGTHVRNEAWNDPLRLYADGGTARSEARTLLTLADEQRRAGRLAEADATLREVIALEPASAPAYVNVGMVAWARGDAGGAERALRQSIAILPTAEAWYDLGCLLSDGRRETEAEAALEQALALNPGYVRAHLNLATVAIRRGDVPRALARLDEAIRIDPGYVLAYQNRALLGLRVGRLEGAVEDARAAARLAPESADAHAILGDALRAAGRAPEASAAYERALALDPRNARAGGGRAALGR